MQRGMFGGTNLLHGLRRPAFANRRRALRRHVSQYFPFLEHDAHAPFFRFNSRRPLRPALRVDAREWARATAIGCGAIERAVSIEEGSDFHC